MEELNEEEMLGTEGGACTRSTAKYWNISIDPNTSGNQLFFTVGAKVSVIQLQRAWAGRRYFGY